MAAQLSVLIASVLTKPEIVQRRVSALVGAVVADAASQHLQWIYNQEELALIVGDKDPEFWPDNKCPYFSLPNGLLTCYGDEIVTTLNHISSNNNTFDEEKLLKSIYEKFGRSDSPYQVALAKRPSKKYPIDGPWLNSGVIKCLGNYANATRPTGCKDNHDADGIWLALPIIIQGKSTDNFDSFVKPVVQTLTTNDQTLANNEVQAKLIQAFVENEDDPIAKIKSDFAVKFPEIVEDIEAVEEWKATGADTPNLVKKFGMACPLPGSFHSSLVSIIDARSYVSAVRDNLKAGGDVCSRAVMVGACLGAKFGLQSIPHDWLQKVDGIEEIIREAEQVMQ